MLRFCSLLCFIAALKYSIVPLKATSCSGSPGKFKPVEGLDPHRCYHLVLPGTGIISPEFFVDIYTAMGECWNLGGRLIRDHTPSQLAATKAWLVRQYGSYFIDVNKKALQNGIWQGYYRFEVPLFNRSYEEEVKPKRIDPNGYYDLYSLLDEVDGSEKPFSDWRHMPESVWRTSGKNPQPNDKPNNNDPSLYDEQCVAMKRINNPRINGLDDYDCNDGIHHAVLCESSASVSACDQPKVSGMCLASFPRFYFNQTSGTCEGFIYGGCEGNENNFNTEQECISTCADKKNLIS